MHRTCIQCGGNMPLKTVSKTFNINGQDTTVHGIESYVCENCGEEVYANIEVKKIEKAISEAN